MTISDAMSGAPGREGAVECPKCHEPFQFAITVPDSQRFTMELETENPYIASQTLGGVIIETDKLLVAVAKSIGQKVGTMVERIDWSGNKIRITFLILAVSKALKD